MAALHMCCASDTSAQRILALRQQQWAASYPEYVACDQEVREIKQEVGVSEVSTGWEEYYAYVHTVPWIIWQVSLILVAILLGIYLPDVWQGRHVIFVIFLSLLLISVGYIVWRGECERTQEAGVIHKNEVPLYIGPDTTYPIHTYLAYLDEIEVQERLEDWIKVRYPEGYGWIQRDDLTYVS